MATPEFGLLCNQEEASLCRRVYMELTKLETAIGGPLLLECRCNDLKDDEDRLIYVPHESHEIALAIVCVDSLCELTVMIDRIENFDVQFFLRDFYYHVKAKICRNDEAQAYHLNR